MPETLIQSNLDRGQQVFFIDDQEINGVQNVVVDYRNNISNVKYLGLNRSVEALRGLQPGSVSTTVSVLTNDQFIAYTGSVGVKGAIYRADSTENGFAFKNAYLSSYSSRYALGQLPQIEASFVCLGDVGNIPRSEIAVNGDDIFNKSNNVLYIPGPGCLSINLDEFETNRLLGYTVSFSVNRTPVYAVGQRTPLQVFTALPINVVCAFQFEVNDYEAYKQFQYPTNPVVRQATLSLHDYKTRAEILSYNFSSLTLDGETYEMNENGNATITATYKTFLV